MIDARSLLSPTEDLPCEYTGNPDAFARASVYAETGRVVLRWALTSPASCSFISYMTYVSRMRVRSRSGRSFTYKEIIEECEFNADGEWREITKNLEI